MLKGFCRYMAFLAFGFLIVLLIKKVEGHWDNLFFCIFGVVLYFCADYGWKTENVDNLLNGISDDINDIKEKLDLPIFERTPAQHTKEFMKTLKEYIYKGGNIKELFREEELKKYNTWINICINEAGMTKYCTKCQKYFDDASQHPSGEFSVNLGGYKWNCDTCRGNLILRRKPDPLPLP